MTVRALVGLAAFNVFVLAVGACVFWAVRGFRSWSELVRWSGVAYLTGISSLATALTLALVIGVPFGGLTVLAAGALVASGSVLLGRTRGVATPELRRPQWRVVGLTGFGAVWAAGIVLYLEALFRSARLTGEAEWDAWRCWSLRAKAIYETNGLDTAVFASPACPGYPPGWSVLEASAFHALGSADVVTVHVQYWFLALGFVAALAGLLAGRVSQAILAPFLLFALVLPSVTERTTDGRADLPLVYLTVTGAVLVLLWIEDRHTWRLVAATPLFAGALLTKREGLLLFAIVFAAALAATVREWRTAWPPLAASGTAAFALALPWRIWLSFEGVQTGAPPEGYLGLGDHLDRAWPSVRLVVRTFFDYDLWLLATPLALAAAVLALLAGQRRIGVFAAALLGISIVGCAWAIWSEPALEITQDYGLNPVVRLVGGPVLVLVAATPLLLARALPSGTGSRVHTLTRVLEAGRGRAWPWLIVGVALIGYPSSMLVGYSGFRLPGGPPPFPTPDECVSAPAPGGRARVVFGYERTYAAAAELRRRAHGDGFAAEIAQDGCGRLRVFVDDIASVSAGESLAAEARGGGLDATVEGDPDG